MRDVKAQLADYFDATVERITVEDLAASRSVQNQPERQPTRVGRLRPAWAVAVTFVTTMAVIGGSLGFGLMLRRQGTDAGGATPAPTIGQSGGTSTAVILGVTVIVLLILVGALLAARGRAKRLANNGGVAMTTTLERPSASDERVDKLLKTNRTLTLMAIVLAVLAVGFGSWAVYEATSGDDVAAVPATTTPATTVAAATPTVPPEVAAVIDDWWDANNRRDGSIVELYEIGGFHQFSTERFFGDAMASNLAGPAGWSAEWIGEPILVVDEGDGRYVVVRGVRQIAAAESFAGAVAFEMRTQTDGSLLLAHTAWIWVSD